MMLFRRPSEGWGPSDVRPPVSFTPRDPSFRWDDDSHAALAFGLR